MPVSGSNVSSAVIRLHVGGEEPKEGWSILNIQPGLHVDYVGNCTDLSMFPNDSLDEIYASHVLEHLGYKVDLKQALKEFYRALKPGGRIRISVPDLEVLCRIILSPDGDTQQRFNVMRMMFGGQIDEFDFHHVGLTWEFLGTFLDQYGFREITRVREFGIFDDDSSFRFAGQLISLNVEVIK